MNRQKIKNAQNSTLDNVNINIKREVSKAVYHHWFLWFIVIIVLLAILATQIPKIDISSNYVAVVLGFVGVIATFIVVGNYMQVKDVKDQYSAKVEELKDEIRKEIEKESLRLKKNIDGKFYFSGAENHFRQIQFAKQMDNNDFLSICDALFFEESMYAIDCFIDSSDFGYASGLLEKITTEYAEREARIERCKEYRYFGVLHKCEKVFNQEQRQMVKTVRKIIEKSNKI